MIQGVVLEKVNTFHYVLYGLFHKYFVGKYGCRGSEENNFSECLAPN